MAATDEFSTNSAGLDSPPSKFAAITPNDTTDLAFVTRCIHVGVGGDIAIIGAGDTASVVLKNLQSGQVVSGRFSRVLATGTTATNLVAER